MNASSVLSQLHYMGVAVTVATDKVRLQPGSRVPPEILEFIREHKADVITMLSSQPPIEISAEPCLVCRSRLTRSGECAGRCAIHECVPCLCDIAPNASQSRPDFFQYPFASSIPERIECRGRRVDRFRHRTWIRQISAQSGARKFLGVRVLSTIAQRTSDPPDHHHRN